MKTKLIWIVGLGAAAVILAACKHQLSQAEAGIAELGAVKYSQAIGGTFISCSGQDSDGDGYVSCTIKDKNEVVTPIACSYEGASGCKQK